MSATYTIDPKTGHALFYVSRQWAPAGTFHAGYITLDAKAVVAEADFIVEDAFIQANYTLVPKRTIDDFLRAHEADMARYPRKRYVDVDLPMMDEDSDW